MQFLNNSHYSPAQDIRYDDGAIPLTWWVLAPNFGDLLSPYLVNKITNKPVKLVHIKVAKNRKYDSIKFRKPKFSYLAIGSIISRANSKSVVWGSGAFGTEGKSDLNSSATYLSVRGPLTRNLLRIHGIDCPENYGDPALLIPHVFNPVVEKKYKIGMILRWSEKEWNIETSGGIKKIYLGTDDIEGTLTDILSCEKILSSSLHGIVLADAYGIPSAWLCSTTPKGLEFKFYDYFISVNKIQKPQNVDFTKGVISAKDIEEKLYFNEKKIEFDVKKILDTCPFIQLRQD